MDRKITKITISEARELITDSGCHYCADNLAKAIELKREFVWLWGTDIYLTRAKARQARPKKIPNIFGD